MNAAGFWRGVGLAVLLSVVGGVAFTLFAPLLGGQIAMRGVLLLVAGGCLADMLLRNQAVAGRLLSAALAVLIAAALLIFDPPLWFWWSVLAGYLWLLRSLGRGATPLRALIDGALTLIGLACALATLRQSGSVWLALWCWLLLQAIAGAITASRRQSKADGDHFSRARQNAQAALRSLQQPRSTN